MTLIKRTVKGTPLTWQEGDDNLQYLEDLINNIPTGSGNLFEGEIDVLLFSPDFNSISNWEETFVKPISVLSGGALTGLQCKGILIEGSAIEDSGDYGLTPGSPIEIKTFVFQGAADGGPFEGTTDIWIGLTIQIQSFLDTDDLLGYGNDYIIFQIYSLQADDNKINYIFDLAPLGVVDDLHNIRFLDNVNFQDYLNENVFTIDNVGNITQINPVISNEVVGTTSNVTINYVIPEYTTDVDADNDTNLESNSIYRLTGDRTLYIKP